MDIEERVTRLEEKFEKMELSINDKLSKIQESIVGLESYLKASASDGDLKNKLIIKDVERLEEKVRKQEDSQIWIVRLLIGSIVGLVLEAIAFYIKTKP